MPTDITFSAEEELAAYRAMLLIRRFEEKAGQLYALGAFAGPCPLAIGQEGAVVGLAMALSSDDPIVTGPRSHGPLLARGVAPERLMGEILGRSTGLNGGRSGSISASAPEAACLGGFATPGLPASMAAGLAFVARYRRQDRVALALYGDGSEATGRVFEAYRIAAEHKLPVIFAIDNNSADPAPGAPAGQGRAPLALKETAGLFGLAYDEVDGIDVRKVRAQAREAVARARRGEGATIIELLTYRYRGHGGVAAKAGSGPSRRDDADPVLRARARILETAAAREPELKVLEREVKDVVAAAAQAAKAAPRPAFPGLSAEAPA